MEALDELAAEESAALSSLRNEFRRREKEIRASAPLGTPCEATAPSTALPTALTVANSSDVSAGPAPAPAPEPSAASEPPELRATAQVPQPEVERLQHKMSELPLQPALTTHGAFEISETDTPFNSLAEEQCEAPLDVGVQGPQPSASVSPSLRPVSVRISRASTVSSMSLCAAVGPVATATTAPAASGADAESEDGVHPSTQPRKRASTTGTRLALWEREEAEKHSLEQQRAQRIAALDVQRQNEAVAAEERQAAWKRSEDERLEGERRQFLAKEAEREAANLKLAEENRQMFAQQEEDMAAEQAKLDEERRRQVQLKKEREAPKVLLGDADEFSYHLQAGMAEKVKAFRRKGRGGDTLIMQIKHELNELQIEEAATGMSLEDLADRLEDFALVGQPRYVLHIHEFAHKDGRVSYPIAFVMFMPENIPVQLKVLYTRPVSKLCETFSVNKHFALDDPESLDQEWLEVQLGLRSA